MARTRKENPFAGEGFSIDRPQYKDKAGKQCTLRHWQIRFKDHRNLWRKMPGHTDKAATATFARKLRQLAQCRFNNSPLDTDMARWVEDLPDTTREQLIGFGVLDIRAATASLSITSHLEDWKQSILDDGCTFNHAEEQWKRASRLIQGCDFRRFAGINHSAAKSWIARNVKKHNTRNGYIGAIRQFCAWMVADDRATRSPVLKLKKVKVTDKTEKRALSIAELEKLIQTTHKAQDRSKMPGRERALLYTLACETAYRAAELRSLRVSNFDLAYDFNIHPPKQPTVRVKAAYAKNDRADILTISPELARWLQRHFSNKLPGAVAFNMPRKTAVMVRRDLERAGIEATDAMGDVFNFHALRTQAATNLARGGAHVAVAQKRLRHGTVQLTLDVYTKLGLDEHQDAALKALPNLSMRMG